MITLGDRRQLEIRVSGPPDGLPLIFHHGTPFSSVPLRIIERPAHARGLRFVTFSRAGYGTSTRHPGRSVADVVADTEAVLASLSAERCVVAGWSGGGPHALACAARLPQAESALVIAGVAPFVGSDGLDWIAGMGEDNVVEFGAALEGPDALRPYLQAQAAMLAGAAPDEIVSAMASLVPPVDQTALSGDLSEDVIAGMREGLAHGIDGWLDDDLAFVAPWGFELSEISRPVSLWQGSSDLMVPFAHGEWLAARVPGASVHLVPDAGHFSVAGGNADVMLDELTAALSG